jgi:DNA-binding MarR family transcriptional regulator
MRIETFLAHSPLYSISRAARSLQPLEGLSLHEALVLAAILFEEPGNVKPSSLAETFETTRGSVSHWISSLESKGLLQRRVDPEDARSFLLVLKPQGRKRAMQAVKALDRMQGRFEKEIGSAELKRAIDVIRRVELSAKI